MPALELLAHLDVAAASGVVWHQGSLFVVADDGLALLRVSLEGSSPSLLPLRPGAGGAALAKAAKPDFEALLEVGGRLLALGSGSGPARRRGVWLAVTGGPPAEVDFSPLYAALASRFEALNVEGGVARGGEVLLAQRGNGPGREDALVRLDRAVFEVEVAAGEVTARALRGVTPVALGALEGVPLSLTDLCVGPRGELLFTAAAEATDNPWDDGEVAGSVVGVLAADGRAEGASLLTAAGVKLEGVCAVEVAGRWELRLVADPDDASARAPLYRCGWPR
ncbi:MAG: hypothetical protein IT380_04455 [Myxococcales bacterium]|nr:hypothetical protein [Myxococcales bacterium]